jgi:hypothetical protein
MGKPGDPGGVRPSRELQPRTTATVRRELGMTEWVTHTPDGLTLHISRERDTWIVQCEDGDKVRAKCSTSP